MWGCGLRPHPHIYPSPLLKGVFFSALINLKKWLVSGGKMARFGEMTD